MWVHKQQDIANAICFHFRQVFFSSKNVPSDRIKRQILSLIIPELGPNQVELLNQPFIVEEVKKATFKIRPFKAPMVDGKPGIFYQKYCHIVGSLTTNSSIAFLNSSFLLNELIKTLLVLIPN